MVVDKREGSSAAAIEIENFPVAPEIQRDNGDVLLDIGAADTKLGATALKLSADGHVSVLCIIKPPLRQIFLTETTDRPSLCLSLPMIPTTLSTGNYNETICLSSD